MMDLGLVVLSVRTMRTDIGRSDKSDSTNGPKVAT